MAGEDWKMVPVSQICDIHIGGTPRREEPSYWGGNIKWASAKDVASCSSRYLRGTEETITQKGLKESAAKLLDKDTIVITARGTVGAMCMLPESMSFNQTCYGLIAKPQVDPEYLYYALKAALKRILTLTYGTVFETITIKSFDKIEVPLPALKVQRAIAHILGSLDDKIELNRKMNETLEAMARAIFKSWFIDFDPVKRNMARKTGQNQPSPRPPLPMGEGRRGEGAKHEGRGGYRGGYDFSGLVETARQLRSKQTPAETIFWDLVRDRRFMGLKFRRQHQLGDYVADFYCHEHKLVIELDGGIHASKQKKDHKRDAWMEAQGFTVLRFPNEQVLEDPRSVLEEIATYCIEGGSESSSPFGRGGGEGSVEALDRLFPDEFEDSELGEIPKGWRVDTLGNILELAYGKGLREQDRRPGPFPVFGSNGQVGWHDEKLVDGPGIIVGRKGNPGIVTWSHLDFFPIDTTFYVVPKQKELSLYFLFYALQTHDLPSLGADSAVPGLNRNLAYMNQQVMPSSAILKVFVPLVKPMFDRIHASNVESNTLSALRDALLPKLISGEIRLKDAEKMVEGTA